MEPKDIENPKAEEDFRSQITTEKYKELAEKYKLYFALIKDSEKLKIEIITLEEEIKSK